MNTADYAYPFDPTGKQSSNAVANEQQVISPPNNWKDYYFLIPRYAPFFREGFSAVHKASGKKLVEGVDFLFTHQFRAASKGTAKPIFGSITFFDKSLTGVIVLKYQTLGGLWTQSETKIAQILANNQLNPRITTWDQIVDMPVLFPPIDHEWNVDDLIGMSAVVNKLEDIRAALSVADQNALLAHIGDKNNPHQVNKQQVGLGAVQNYGIATTLQAQGGTSNDTYMTPLRTKEAIQKFAGGGLQDHINDHSNPHAVTKEQVQLGKVDNYATASQLEAESGTATDRFMTPLRTAQAIAKLGLEPLTNHINDKNNPHQTTKFHVGLGQVEDYPPATQQQAQAGTDNASYTTPLRTAQAIEALVGRTLREHLNDLDNPHQVTPAQIGAYGRDETNILLELKLDRSAQAYDSGKLDGKTLEEIMADVVASTVTNTDHFGGQTPDEFRRQTLNGQSADSAKLGGKTLAQVISEISAGTDPSGWLARQAVFAAPDVIKTASFTRLMTMPIPDLADEFAVHPDLQFILSGGDSEEDGKSPLLLFRLSVRSGAPVLSVANLNNVPCTSQFGYAIAADTNSYEIWMRSAQERNEMTITELTKGVGATSDEWPVQEEVPAGYTAITGIVNYWTTENFDPKSKLDATATAVNSSKFEGQTLQEVKDAIGNNGSSYNAKRLEMKTLSEVLALAQKQKAADSFLLEGSSKAEVISAAQAGTAANASKLANLDLAGVKTEVLKGTAADASKLGGQLPSYYATAEYAQQLRADLDALIASLSESFQEANDDINS